MLASCGELGGGVGPPVDACAQRLHARTLRCILCRVAAVGVTSQATVLLLVTLVSTGCQRDKSEQEAAALGCASEDFPCQEAQCAAGVGSSCTALAQAHEEGAGVRRDLARAAKLYERACERGHADGCAGLAVMLDEGRRGARDPERGL